VPFRKPRRLTLGTPERSARLYLSEDDVPGFVLVEAKTPGPWGNDIAVTARPVGPARFDVAVSYEAGRFECARAIVAGEPPPAQIQELIKPRPVGVLRAKAAGIEAEVTRDRAGDGPAATTRKES
jgi:hypothetical protein